MTPTDLIAALGSDPRVESLYINRGTIDGVTYLSIDAHVPSTGALDRIVADMGLPEPVYHHEGGMMWVGSEFRCETHSVHIYTRLQARAA
jgi:hypothetical protein